MEIPPKLKEFLEICADPYNSYFEVPKREIEPILLLAVEMAEALEDGDQYNRIVILKKFKELK